MNEILYDITHCNKQSSVPYEKGFATVYVETSFRKDQFFHTIMTLLSYTKPKLSGYFVNNPFEITRNELSIHDGDNRDIITYNRNVINQLYTLGCLRIKCQVNAKNYFGTPDNSQMNYEMDVRLRNAKEFFELLERGLLNERIMINVNFNNLTELTKNFHYDLFHVNLTGFDDSEIILKKFENCAKLVEKKFSDHPETYTVVVHILRKMKPSSFSEIHIFERLIENVKPELKYPAITMLYECLIEQKIPNNITTVNDLIFIEAEGNADLCSKEIILNIDRILRQVDRALDPSFEDDEFFNDCIKFHKEKYGESIPVDVIASNKYHINDHLGMIFIKPGYGKEYAEACMKFKEYGIGNAYYVENGDATGSIHISFSGLLVDAEKWFSEKELDIYKYANDAIAQKEKDEKYSKIIISPQYFPELAVPKALEIDVPMDSNKFDFDCDALLTWILQKFPYHPDPPYPSGVAYIRKYLFYEKSGSKYLSIDLCHGCGYTQSLREEFESHIKNFITIRDIKKEVEDNVINHTFVFSTFEDEMINAALVCHDGKNHMFVDESHSDSAKDYMKSFCATFRGSEYEMIYHEAPAFIIDMIKEIFQMHPKNQTVSRLTLL